MTEPRRRRTKAELNSELKIEQRELLKQFEREWWERTLPTDRFSITPGRMRNGQ